MDPKPWEKQPAESEAHFELFKRYLKQPRTRRSCKRLGGSAIETSELYSLYQWRDRCEAYDRHMDRVEVEEVEKVLKRNAAERTARRLALAEEILEKVEEELPNMKGLKPSELIKWFEVAITKEQLLTNQPTEIIEHGMDFSKLSDEELDKMLELEKKAAKPE